VTGYWLLVTGYWLLVTGYWLLVTGYWFTFAFGSGELARLWPGSVTPFGRELASLGSGY
jgi:hypothetical protein